MQEGVVGGGGGGSLKLRQHYQGQLNKYTNVMKGWQFRWFVLNPDKGTLEYHVTESEVRQSGSRARGILFLGGAVISPSEEDSHTFVVHGANGDLYKLRAVDAKERQEWITRIRVVAEIHSQSGAVNERQVVATNVTVLDAFSQVTDWLTKAEATASEISSAIDKFPLSGPGAKCTDPELLLLKASSQATLGSLEECLYALQLQQRALSSASASATSATNSSNNTINTHNSNSPKAKGPFGSNSSVKF